MIEGCREREISVLLVEDSPTQAMFVKDMLERAGVTTTVAANGRDALSLLGSYRPTLVLSDIRMPGMDGYELCAAIRSDGLLSDLPVVLLTSLSTPTDVIKALECGADNFITKPCSEDQLFSIINSIVDSMKLGMKLTGESGNDVIFRGERYHIRHERRRIISLLISTYESAVDKNRELLSSQQKLINLNRQLETALAEKSRAVKLAEETLEKLSQKESVIKQWNHELVHLRNIEYLLHHSSSDAEIYPMACEKLVSSGVFGITRDAKVGLLQDRLLSCCHATAGEAAAHRCRERVAGEQLCGKSIESGTIRVAPEGGDPALCPESPRHGRIAIPLLAKEKSIGVLCCGLISGTVLDERQLDLLASLGRQIGMAVENLRLFRETVQLSLQDPLTGLANRRRLEIDYQICAARAQRYRVPFCLLLVDVDHFKTYNDTYGHDSGDAILRKTADVLRGGLRNTDLAVRYGGEEFVLLLSDSDLASGLQVAERLREAISESVKVTVSIGVAEHVSGDSLDVLLKKADIQLYAAKNGGRDRVEPSPVAAVLRPVTNGI